MFALLDRSLSLLRSLGGAWSRSVVGVGVTAIVLVGTAAPLLARPPNSDSPPQGRRQVGDMDRAEIRRSMGRPQEAQPDAYRERRRMSEAERQSLRQAVRDAYGDPRGRGR